MQLLINFIFDEMNIHKIKLSVYSFNQRAIRCYEKCAQINSISCKASIKDLEADIDAVVLCQMYRKKNEELIKLLERFYLNLENFASRYDIFKAETIRIGGGYANNRFEGVLKATAVGTYDSVTGLTGGTAILAKFTPIFYVQESARVFAEYVNSKGSITKGESLSWNDT